MFIELLPFTVGAAALLSGIIAGVLLAFSDFVMTSLTAARAAVGVEAMQIINRRVYRSLFLVLLLGMVPVSLAIAVYGYSDLSGMASAWLIWGGLIYLVGVFGVTIMCNVPMNKKLDLMDHNAPETASYWTVYSLYWTRWNHLRTLASGASSVCYFAGCLALLQA